MATAVATDSASTDLAPLDTALESSTGEGSKLKSKKDILYEKCAEAPPDTIFEQRELANMQVAENTAALIELLHELVASHLMKTLTWENQACWKLRTREEAAK